MISPNKIIICGTNTIIPLRPATTPLISRSLAFTPVTASEKFTWMAFSVVTVEPAMGDWPLTGAHDVELRDYLPVWDAMITEVNARVRAEHRMP